MVNGYSNLGNKLGSRKCIHWELIRWCCVEGHNLKMFSFGLSCILMLLLIVLTKCKIKTWTFVKKYIKITDIPKYSSLCFLSFRNQKAIFRSTESRRGPNANCKKKKKTSHGSTLALVHHFCTSYRHPKQTRPSSRCLVTRSSGETKRGTMSFYPCVIICTSGGNCILCITQGLVCSNLKTGITHTDTVLHCPN